MIIAQRIVERGDEKTQIVAPDTVQKHLVNIKSDY